MNIENITEEEYLSILPKYQREIVNELINSYGIERAVDKWIESNGPQNNVQFGGDGDGSLLSKIKDTIKIGVPSGKRGITTLRIFLTIDDPFIFNVFRPIFIQRFSQVI